MLKRKALVRRPESACSSNNLMQNPKSQLQNPNGPVWACHKQNGYYNNTKSKIRNPSGAFGIGFGMAGGACGKRRCMAIPAARIWPSWSAPRKQPKGARLDSARARAKLGTGFQRDIMLEIWLRFPATVSWKPGPNFQRNGGHL